MEVEIPKRTLLLVGAAAVGKTTLLLRLKQGHFVTGHVPRFLDYSPVITMEEGRVVWDMRDMPGDPVYDDLRSKRFRIADMIGFCFSSDSKESLRTLREKLIPEMVDQGSDERCGYFILQTKCDLYDHRIKKQMRERMQRDHPRVLNSFLREIEEDSESEIWVPSDLVSLLLRFAEYHSEEIEYDPDIEQRLIDEDQIQDMLENDLKFGFWKGEKKALFIRTSAVNGTGLDDGSLYKCFEKCHSHYQSHLQISQKKHTCHLM